jgi:8-oxo-dGTP pyrophosphatase MutT (NUDIX family)
VKQVAKIFIRTEESYLFSRKRAPGKQKDKRLELVGGGLEKGERPFEALVREAAEEESSGRLAAEIRRQTPSYDKVVLLVKGIDEPQYLFHIEIDAETAEALKADPEESHGLERIPVSLFESDEELRTMREEFTPKTVAILRAMGWDL